MTAEQLFDEHHRAVYRFVYRLAGRADFAEDITQDCFVAFLSQPQRWKADRGDLRTYLFSIARNLAFKRFRNDRFLLHEDAEYALSIPDPRLNQELPVVVAQMVSQLPDLQREVLILFEYEGFQLNEIAKIVDADAGAVKSRLHRARESLKRLLSPYRKVVAHDVRE